MDNYKRREFIKLSALGFAGIALQLTSISAYAQKANGHLGRYNPDTKLNWDAFMERLTKLAKKQHREPWNQKRYTNQVKRLLLKCNFPEFENISEVFDNYEDLRPNWFESQNLHHEVDFQVSLFQFEKGEYIPHHDHPEMTGVLNVISGNLLTKNYTFEEQLPSDFKGETKDKKCTIREVGNEILKAGDVGILTAHEGNIHSIMPNDFTQMIDVFTPAYKHDTNASWYDVNEDEYYLGREKVYAATYGDTKP